MQAASSTIPLAPQAAAQAASSTQPSSATIHDFSAAQTHQSPSEPELGPQAQASHHVLSVSAGLHCVSASSKVERNAGLSLAPRLSVLPPFVACTSSTQQAVASQEASISRRLSADRAAATASQPPTLPSTNSGDAEAAPARPVHRPSRSMAQAADSTGESHFAK